MVNEAVSSQIEAVSQNDSIIPSAEYIVAGCILLVICLVFVFLYSLCDAVINCAVGSVRMNDDDPDKKRAKRIGRILSMPHKYRYPLRIGQMVFGSIFLFFVVTLFLNMLSQSLAPSVVGQTGSNVLSCVILLTGSVILLSVIWIIPQRIASDQPDKKLSSLSGMIQLLSVIFFPLNAVCSLLSSFVMLIFGHGGKQRKSESKPTEEKIMIMVDEGEENGTIEENTRSMIENVFEFDDTTVGEVMTHRKDVVAVRDDDTIMNLTKRAIDSGKSRIPVYHEDIDNIIGMI